MNYASFCYTMQIPFIMFVLNRFEIRATCINFPVFYSFYWEKNYFSAVSTFTYEISVKTYLKANFFKFRPSFRSFKSSSLKTLEHEAASIEVMAAIWTTFLFPIFQSTNTVNVNKNEVARSKIKDRDTLELYEEKRENLRTKESKSINQTRSNFHSLLENELRSSSNPFPLSDPLSPLERRNRFHRE